MSIYGEAIGSLAGNAVQLLDDREETALYNDTYNKWSSFYTKRENTRRQMDTLGFGIQHLNKEGVLSDDRIRNEQDNKEGKIAVSAAAAGLRGSSVHSNTYQTKVTEAFSLRDSEAKREEKRKGYLEQNRQLRYNLNNMKEPEDKKKDNPWLAAIGSSASIVSSQEFADGVVNAWDSGAEAWGSEAN